MSTIGVRFGPVRVVDKLCVRFLNRERGCLHAVLSIEPAA